MKGQDRLPVGVVAQQREGNITDDYYTFKELKNDSHLGTKLSEYYFGLNGDQLTQCNTRLLVQDDYPNIPLSSKVVSSTHLDLLYRKSHVVDCLDDTIFPLNPDRNNLANLYNGLSAPFGNYNNNTYPIMAVAGTTDGGLSQPCPQASRTESTCNNLVGMTPTCPTSFNGLNRDEICNYETFPITQALFNLRGDFGFDALDCQGWTQWFCTKTQWDDTFRRDCCLTGGTPDTPWVPPEGPEHDFARQHVDESYKWYCDPSWNTNDGFGKCADVMVQECAGAVAIPDQPGKTGSALLYKPACKLWYDKLKSDTREMLDFSSRGPQGGANFDGILDPTVLNTSLNLRWAAVEDIVSAYCTSEEGRDAPECSCYLYNGTICDGVPPGQPCTFVVKVQPNADPPQRGTGKCTDHVRANLATFTTNAQGQTDDIAALSLQDFVCGAECTPLTKLLNQDQFVRYHGCPTQTCYQVVNECVDVGTIRTQGLVRIADSATQCTGRFGTLDAGSPSLEFSVQHLPVHGGDGGATSSVTVDGVLHLEYVYVTDADGEVLDNPALNGTRLVGMYMVNNVGNAAAALDKWSGSYALPGSQAPVDGFPSFLSVELPVVGQGVTVQSVVNSGSTVSVNGGDQLETVWTLNAPPLGTTTGTLTMKSSSQNISLTMKYVVVAFKASGRQPQQPGGQPYNPGQEPIVVRTLPYDEATGTLDGLRLLAIALLAVVVLLAILILALRWRRRRHHRRHHRHHPSPHHHLSPHRDSTPLAPVPTSAAAAPATTAAADVPAGPSPTTPPAPQAVPQQSSYDQLQAMALPGRVHVTGYPTASPLLSLPPPTSTRGYPPSSPLFSIPG